MAPQPVAAPPGVLADLPVALKVLWTIWLAAVSINMMVWVLLSGTTGHLIYPRPVRVAGPSGAALFAVSAGVTQIRHRRRATPADREVLISFPTPAPTIAPEAEAPPCPSSGNHPSLPKAQLQYGSTAGSSVALAPMRAAAVLAFWAVGKGLAAAARPKTGILP